MFPNLFWKQFSLFLSTLGYFIFFLLSGIFNNKENLSSLVKFNYINQCNPIGNFRFEFIIIMRDFLFGSSKKLLRFYLVTFFLNLSLTTFLFFLECGINPRYLILLILIFIDKGSRSYFMFMSILIKMILGKRTSISASLTYRYEIHIINVSHIIPLYHLDN